MNEVWKPIPGYEEYYEISSLGRVKRIKVGHGTQAGRIIKEYFDKHTGYCRVALSVNSKVKDYSVHRLVAMTFLPNPEEKREVNHINGIKTDNRLENLEWATPSENRIHAYDTGLIDKERISEANKGRKISEDTRKKMSEARKLYYQKLKSA